MPSIRYFNQTAPFWDFVASMEANGDHPFLGGHNTEGRQAPHADNPQADGQASQENQQPAPETNTEEKGKPETTPCGSGAPFAPHEWHHGPFPHHGGHGRGRHHGGPCRGGWGGPRGRGGFPFGGPRPFDLNAIAQFFQQHLGIDPESTENQNDAKDGKDFTPSADVFDTEDAYVIHVALAGAKKEDVGVNWNADKSELSVAGVVYRPGDEEFLKTLAMAERKVGVFERKIRLGSRVSPAQVDADSISAKMEDGVLVVTIPKLDREYVDVKKVDIE